MKKRRPSPIARFRHLDSDRRRLLMQCGYFRGPRRRSGFSVPPGDPVRLRSGTKKALIEDCIWAVEAAARRLPWRTMCIEQGLAAQRLLRSAGIDAVLHYGARQNAPDKAGSSRMGERRGAIVIGGEEAGDFAEIASYP